jgi:lipid II:glycine glycyltransferase (peptidoglycan interpeptide bridge formation enzyme)
MISTTEVQDTHTKKSPGAGVMGEVYSFDPLTDARWNRFIERDERSSVFHSPAWLQTLKRTYGYQPVGYTFSARDKEIDSALVFCRVNSWLTGRRLVSLPFSDHCEPLVNNVDELTALLRPAQEELETRKVKYIDVRPLSLAFSGSPADSETYFLHILDLHPTDGELYKKFHADSIRRKIQRADREHVSMEAGSSEKLLHQFYQLHVITRQRQQLPPHPLQWFRNVLQCLGDGARIRVATKDGKAIASIFSISHKQKMIYKYGCSDAQSHNLGGMQFLFWDLIRDSKQRGFVEIDFGRSECANTGLVTFKDRWGAKRQTITYLRYPHRAHATSEDSSRLMTLGKKIFEHCPQPLLRLAGQLLYPHMG